MWGRNTSIILITFATLVMSISLIMSDRLKVISNGLLLGGLFTMLYGTGWIIATGTSQARFFVMTAALAITLGLGYVRFVRERRDSDSTASAPGSRARPFRSWRRSPHAWTRSSGATRRWLRRSPKRSRARRLRPRQ